MTSLLTARGKDPAAALGFHACAEAMRFGAASFTRLVCALRQNNPPFGAWPHGGQSLLMRSRTDDQWPAESELQTAEAAGFELFSVFEARTQGQETMPIV